MAAERLVDKQGHQEAKSSLGLSVLGLVIKLSSIYMILPALFPIPSAQSHFCSILEVHSVGPEKK